jgi:hypothetical protein
VPIHRTADNRACRTPASLLAAVLVSVVVLCACWVGERHAAASDTAPAASADAPVAPEIGPLNQVHEVDALEDELALIETER